MSDKKKYYSVNEELNDYKKETADLKKDLATAKQRIEDFEKIIDDVKLELSEPETMGMDDEPLYKWAALIVCEKDRYKKELGEIKERNKKLEHHRDTTVGLWAVDRNPVEVDYAWIKRNCFRITE